MVKACIAGGLQCMPMHRAVPGDAEHPHPAESIPPGQTHPQGVAGPTRPDFAPRGIAKYSQLFSTDAPWGAYMHSRLGALQMS